MPTGLYTLSIATSGTALYQFHWRDLCATHCASQKLSVSAWQKHLGTHTTSHHIAWCSCTDYTKFSCLCKSFDGACPFVSATAIQLTPSYTSYTTFLPSQYNLCPHKKQKYGRDHEGNGNYGEQQLAKKYRNSVTTAKPEMSRLFK